MEILVSVNCITYNHEKYISDAINGFLMQKTDFDFEIIIGEDCSSDNTKKIIEKYMKEYPNRIKLITSDKNVGVINNMRRVYQSSVGKYIALCEGDDYWTDPFKLQKQIDYMEKNKGCSLCCHNARIVDASRDEVIGNFKNTNGDKVYSTEEVILGQGAFIATQSIIVRKKIMDTIPKWYWNSSIGDYSLQIIAATQGYIYYINEFMSIYRTNVKGSWTNLNEKKVDKDIIRGTAKVILDILDNFDEYTELKYSKETNQIRIPIKLNIARLNREKNKIKEYKNTEYYLNLTSKKKIYIYIKGLPYIYKWLSKGRIFMENKVNKLKKN